MTTKDKDADPLKVNSRLYKQLGLLLDEMEKHEVDITFPQRLNAFIAIARVQHVFMALRKENKNDDELTGSAVRDAAAAFKKNGNGRGKKSARSAAPTITFDDEDDDDFDAAR
jgi:hypothetical protein